MRARGRQAEPPCAEIPQNGRDEKRKHHGETRAGADLQNQFDRQQRDDRKGHSASGEEHAGKVADSGPHDGDTRLERVGVNDGSDGVGGVMKAVYKLEAEGDEKSQREHEVRRVTGHRGCVEIPGDVEDDVEEAA